MALPLRDRYRSNTEIVKDGGGIASFQLFLDADGYERYMELDTLRDSHWTSSESSRADGPHLWHNTSSKIDGCTDSVLKGSGLFSKDIGDFDASRRAFHGVGRDVSTRLPVSYYRTLSSRSLMIFFISAAFPHPTCRTRLF
ncbi:unnamed protein product [Lasius platythorax]|uniref:Uncharacterized protein n=1 Tax=Lasius platythorax TaxID=488582 RepID=A0AAV2NPN2_9HYME